MEEFKQELKQLLEKHSNLQPQELAKALTEQAFMLDRHHMTIGGFRRIYGEMAAFGAVSILFNDPPKRRDLIEQFIEQHLDHTFTLSPANILDLMTEVNKMVKHETCPNNLKNRFYNKKHKVILHYINNKQTDQIYDCGDFYEVIIQQHSYHQPKNMFKKPIKDISGEKPLETGNQTLSFDKDTYNQFMLKALTLK